MFRHVPNPLPPAVSAHAQVLVRSVARPARAACFWLAVALPLLHVPLLVRGLSTPGEAGAFATLLVANALAIALGRGHVPAGRRTRSAPDEADRTRPDDTPAAD